MRSFWVLPFLFCFSISVPAQDINVDDILQDEEEQLLDDLEELDLEEVQSPSAPQTVDSQSIEESVESLEPTTTESILTEEEEINLDDIMEEETLDAEGPAPTDNEAPTVAEEPKSEEPKSEADQFFDELDLESDEDILVEEEDKTPVITPAPVVETPVEEERPYRPSQDIQVAERLGDNPALDIILPSEEDKAQRTERILSDTYYKDLTRVTTKGHHDHYVEPSPITNSFDFKLGNFPPPELSRDFTYEDVYGTSSSFMFLIGYEWILWDMAVGRIGLKAGTGIMYAQGNGQFDPDGPNAGLEAREKYTLLVFPNSASLVYQLKFWDKQIFVPYIDGGADHFGILEIRDDGAEPGVGGALAAHVAGGLAIMLDFLDPIGMRTVDKTMGINHIYLTVEYRQFIGLDSNLDFTGGLISGGVAFDF